MSLPHGFVIPVGPAGATVEVGVSKHGAILLTVSDKEDPTDATVYLQPKEASRVALALSAAATMAVEYADEEARS